MISNSYILLLITHGILKIRTVLAIFLVAASITVATSSIAGALNLATVSAAKCSETPCDGWGQSTKKAANEDGQAVGEHSSNPDPSDDDHDTPREGLGNFAEDLTGKKNPSDLGYIFDVNLP
jgi:hypothetical protein